MQDQEPPKIEFPCQYPIKVLGRSGENFETIIFEVVEFHAPGFDRETITANVSRKGTFSSITIVITATGPAIGPGAYEVGEEVYVEFTHAKDDIKLGFLESGDSH